MQDSFANKPFSQLTLGKKNTLSSSVGELAKNSNSQKFNQASGNEVSDNEETEYFLSAMQAFVPQKNKTKPWQKLEEQENFVKHFSLNSNKQSKPINKQIRSTQKVNNQIAQKPKNTQTVKKIQTAEINPQLSKHDDCADALSFMDAVKEVSPLKGKGRDIAPQVKPTIDIEQQQESFAQMMQKKVEFSLSLKGEYLEGYVVGLDELTMNNLRSGVYSPEAHLDLHGLNARQAYQSLINFMRSAWYKGLRTVLLIPGRGKNSPDGVGILRAKLQLWLTQDPFKRVVLAFCTALPSDGGAGTMYVLLRKYKKKGKINWERLPVDSDLY